MFKFMMLEDWIAVGVIVGVAIVLMLGVICMPVGNEGLKQEEQEMERDDI